MNAYLFFSYIVISLLGFFFEISRKKTLKSLNFLILFFFVVSSISRKDGYFEYSDLGAYIYRFVENDNSYFGIGYNLLLSVIRLFFDSNVVAFLSVIAGLVILTAFYSLIQWDKSNSRYVSLFLLIFGVYWGFCFTTEVLRTGLAIVFSLLAFAYVKNRNILLGVITYVTSVAFHWTQIFCMPIMFLVYRQGETSKKLKTSSIYLLLLIVILILDMLGFSVLVANVIQVFLKPLLELFGLSDHYSVYLNINDSYSFFHYVTWQYFFYRFYAVVLVYCAIKTKNNGVCLKSYFLGLVIFTLMNQFAAVTRMFWVFATFSIYLLYDYVKSGTDTIFNKVLLVLVIVALQSVMCVNYLGLRF